MSYLDESGAIPYNVLSDYGAKDVLAKQKKLAPFMNSPFESIVKRNSINRDKNIPYAVNFNDRKIKPQRGLINHTKLNLAAATRRPVAFDKSPFEKQIRGRQNYYDISDVRLDLDKYTELLNAETALENAKKMKELQQAQMFLPNVLNKITAHEKLIEMGIMPKGSKPLLTPAEKAYLNMVGNLSPEDLFAKFSEISKTQEAIDEVAGDGGEAKVGEEEDKEEEKTDIGKVSDELDDLIRDLRNKGNSLDEYIDDALEGDPIKEVAKDLVDDVFSSVIKNMDEEAKIQKELEDILNKHKDREDREKAKEAIKEDFADLMDELLLATGGIDAPPPPKSGELFGEDFDFFAKNMIKADIKELGEVYVVNNDILRSFNAKNQTSRISVLEAIADSIGADYNVKGLTGTSLMRTDSTSFKNLDKHITSGKREILIDPVNKIIYWRKV
jgi:hypothetical protein